MKRLHPIWLSLLPIIMLLIGCERPDPQVTVIAANLAGTPPPTPLITPAGLLPAANLPTYLGTPTPDPVSPTEGNAPSQGIHTVNPGETLGYIAQLYGTTVESLLTANQITDTNVIYVGQQLLVPAQSGATSPSFKLIPDSELVLGPALAGFDIAAVASVYGGYLLHYEETVEGQPLSGSAIVDLVAQRHSVSPRLLLALLEYRANWLTQANPANVEYPLGYVNANASGLYRQLSWAANWLNLGFYGRSEAHRTSFTTADGTQLTFAPGINNGTAAVQSYLAASANYANWHHDVGENGFFATFSQLFGNPFAYTYDPLWPADLTQPPLRLPWPSGETWYLTSGPHGGWNSGSAWAAIDLVPEGENLGCGDSEAWVTAMSAGVVVRSGFGAVVVDVDGDGHVGTGWAITYMHLATRDRIAAGTPVQPGDRLGHPSCEGGFSNATHLHLARTFNGRWVSADGPLPFNMGGWIAQGNGIEYEGRLVRGDIVKEACQCWDDINAITAD